MHHRVLFLFISLALITGCTTIPPQEVHSAGGASRITLLDSTPYGAAPKRLTMGAGLSRGVGNRDTGQQEDSTNVDLNAELRIVDRLAVGLQPYYSIVDGSYDSGANLGIALYLRWNFLNSGRWAFSLYPGIGYGKSSAESDGQLCGLFGCFDDNQNSESQVEIVDPRLGFIASYYFNDRNFLSLIPTLYGSHESGSYTISSVPTFSGSRTALEYSAILAYGYIFDIQKLRTMLQFSAGAGNHQGFGPYDTTTHITPMVQLGIQFAIGSDLPNH